ncbi:MAG: YihY/virulence factor BrkB family protein [Actinomycetota bacterium]|nr:YihY/virulence factor BrkB family protein [Actinomycetota bacterium]
MARENRYPDPDDPRKPDELSDLPKESWFATLKRTVKEFSDDNGSDWAAALTYYAVLALFPAVIALIAIIGLVGNPRTTLNTLLQVVSDLGGRSAVEVMRGPLQGLAGQQKAGIFLLVGLLGALWSASGYVSAFSRASNAVYEVEEGRPFWKLRPLQILVTLISVIMLALVAIGLVVSGPLAQSLGNALGVGGVALTAWNIVKWPVMALIVSLVISLLYYAAPNVRQPKFQWFTLGGLFALVVWALASLAFGFYVANFGSYNKTYGSLAGVITFLIWLWITNIAILIGAEFNAELERARELQARIPGAEEEIQLPPRQEKKVKR